MGVWKPTKYANWIFAIVIIPTVIVGIWIITLAQGIPEGGPKSFLGLSLRNQIYALGIFFIVSPFIGTAWTMLWIGRGQNRAAWLIKNGVQGTGKVLGYDETGMYVNNVPKIELRLEITTSRHGTYQITHDEYINLLYLSKLSIGKELQIMVDPQDQKNIFINLEQLKYG